MTGRGRRASLAALMLVALVVTACTGGGATPTPTVRPATAAPATAAPATAEPSAEPATAAPATAEPTAEPTAAPATAEPTAAPATAAPATAEPSAPASVAPSPVASVEPTTVPSGAPSPAISAAPSLEPSAAPSPLASLAASEAPSAAPAEGMLARILDAGIIRVNTDPNYAPQSFQNPDGTFDGFDIDVTKEIAKRLGVEVEFTTFAFDLVTAGGWNDRWDMSVGSVTVTEERQGVLEFTSPYYYTPAQMAATVTSGITTLEELAGQVICVGSGTTYLSWLEGSLTLVGAPDPAPVPEGATPFPLGTDQDCAQAVQSGRTDFSGWLSSSTTVDAALKAGTPMVTVGDPVFYEALAVAFDITVPDNDDLVARIDAIVAEMHADGTLSTLSEKWFEGLDLTKVAE